MIPSFSHRNQTKILIPIKASLILFFITWLIHLPISISSFNSINALTINQNLIPNSTKSQFGNSTTMSNHKKKLRRLPHIFNRVLELPLKSDADVLIEETSDCFRFVFPVTEKLCGGDGVRAHAIEIHPGVVKIVVNRFGTGLMKLDELGIDTWRYRLPASTVPSTVTALCVGGELIVTVPKIEEDCEREIFVGRIVSVQ